MGSDDSPAGGDEQETEKRADLDLTEEELAELEEELDEESLDAISEVLEE
jgi:hypothetical protein